MPYPEQYVTHKSGVYPTHETKTLILTIERQGEHRGIPEFPFFLCALYLRGEFFPPVPLLGHAPKAPRRSHNLNAG